MECRHAQASLEAYLDGELGRAESRELEAHLDTCEACGAALAALDDLRRALREPALRHAAPAALRARIAAAAPPRPAAARAPAWLRHAAAWLLAFAAGGACVYAWTLRHDAQAQLAHDLFASHWRALAAASPVDVVSADRHTVKPWFAGKLAQSPPVQDFADQGFALLGGRIDYLDGERVPVLVYRHGQHVIDVFVLGQIAAVPERSEQRGYSLVAGTLGQQRAAVVSDMDGEELRHFRDVLSGAK